MRQGPADYLRSQWAQMLGSGDDWVGGEDGGSLSEKGPGVPCGCRARGGGDTVRGSHLDGG